MMTTSFSESLADNAPGRTCPLHYRYDPCVFNQPPSPELADLDVLYVVGGLYGNVLALDAIESMFALESGNKRLVFNGDFHWFDADPTMFSQIETGVGKHLAVRGNVETELASEDDEAGCGCAYPDWVEDGIVERSNLILQRLRGCMTTGVRQRLLSLGMWQVASVGHHRVGIVHGDAQSLAGWGFAQEHLQDPAHQETVANWFAAAQVDVFASTHTCLPVMQAIKPRVHSGLKSSHKPGWIINNGAAGMPNFEGNTAGLLTRIAKSPYDGPASMAHVQSDGLNIDLLAIEFDQVHWQEMFMHVWPEGSHAQQSYWQRITKGPSYQPSQVIRP